MGTLLLRSFGLLVLFQVLATTVLWAGRRRRSTRVALGFGAGLCGLAFATHDAEAPLFLGSGVAAGWLVDQAVRRGWSLWPTVLVGSMPIVLTAVFGLAHPNPRQAWQELSAQVDSLAAGATVPPPASSQPPPEEQRLLEQSQRLATTASRWALRLLPAEILALALLQVLPLVVVAGGIRARSGLPVAVLPVTGWQVPFASIWGLALGLGLAATRSPVARIAGANLVLIVGAALAVQGLAVLWSWLERGLPPAARALLLASMVLAAWPFLALTLALLGTADLWVDFRRLRAVTEDS